MKRLLLAAACLLGAAAAPVQAADCALPSAGVQLADGLVRDCAPPAMSAASSARPVTGLGCAGPLCTADWRTVRATPGFPGDGILSGDMAVTSADESVVAVASYSGGAATVTAFDAATGAERWSTTFAGAATARPFSIARAADGSYAVALQDLDPITPTGIAWIVDPAGTTRHVVPAGAGTDVLDVAAAGDLVVLAGTRTAPTRASAFAVDPRTGEIAWIASWASESPGMERTTGWRIAGTPERAYLAAGTTDATNMTVELTLVTIDAASGEIERTASRRGSGYPPASVVASPDGARVALVTANYETRLNEILTVMFDRDGVLQWSRSFKGCDTFKCSTRPWYGTPAAFTGDGTHLVAAGLGVTVGGNTAWETVGYDTTTGTEQYRTRTPMNPKDCFCGPSVTTRGDEVYVAGTLFDAAVTTDAITIAYDRAGAMRWLARERRPDTSTDASSALVAGGRVVTVGTERTPGVGPGHLTVTAYPR